MTDYNDPDLKILHKLKQDYGTELGLTTNDNLDFLNIFCDFLDEYRVPQEEINNIKTYYSEIIKKLPTSSSSSSFSNSSNSIHTSFPSFPSFSSDRKSSSRNLSISSSDSLIHDDSTKSDFSDFSDGEKENYDDSSYISDEK